LTKEELQQGISLDQILETAALTPLFQPIVSLKKNKIYGYEALIRGPSDSILHSPINLFDAASRHGRLAELDLLCREVAIKQFGQLKLEEKLFINTIPEVLLQQDYQHGLTLDFIKRADLPANQVVIELTEQYPISDYKLMRDATDHYRKMGFSIAIDDLGAGYSGLRTWSEIKPDFVKLDRHFIQNIHQDQHKRQFVQSMVDIAKGVNCKVIGEGIEVREEYLTASEMNIDFAQGYYFGRPAIQPKKEIESELFSKRKPSLAPTLHASRSNTLVRSLLINVPPIQVTDTVSHVGERFHQSLELSGLPVINNDSSIAGMIWRDEFMTLYASRYGRELHGRKPIHLFLDSEPTIADISLPLKKLSHQITSQDNSIQHGVFVITEKNQYRGIGSLMDLLRQITDLQISMARHANPLSGLPGNVPITEHTIEILEKSHDVVMCYFDLDNFKPYNDIYGFAKGDKIIRSTAELLVNHADPESDFIGHVGGDDFIVFFASKDWEQRCHAIFSDFIDLYSEFYNDEHLEQQGMSARDRYGNTIFYPLLALSIGAVRILDFPSITTEEDLSEFATKAKSASKKSQGNSLYQLHPQYDLG
jgi:EAL domain-containing protein (putative c-di-GMP-specific phosphodiesterase class I)/GGDEF domain-containing protein